YNPDGVDAFSIFFENLELDEVFFDLGGTEHVLGPLNTVIHNPTIRATATVRPGWSFTDDFSPFSTGGTLDITLNGVDFDPTQDGTYTFTVPNPTASFTLVAAVPEPASFALLLVGGLLGGTRMWLWRKWRQRAAHSGTS